MSTIVVCSSEPRAGRSVIAAAVAYRLGRDEHPVTLVRLLGDDSADDDAHSFAALEGIRSPSSACTVEQLKAVEGDVVVEAPPGPFADANALKDCRVIEVAGPSSRPLELGSEALLGRVVTRVPSAQLDNVRARAAVLAALPEDRILAAPSVADIAAAIQARWLAGGRDGQAVETVMIGTVASDAAEPYFANRGGTCVITRFDKTDIQLAALQTHVRCLVLTSGGTPSPYLIDRVQSSRDDIALLAASGSTADTVRAIEPLFGVSRFDGEAKLARAVALLDDAGVSLQV